MRNYSRAFVFSVCLLLLVLVPFAVARGGSAAQALPMIAGPERIPAAFVAGTPGYPSNPAVSGDGRYVTFQSPADNLVPNDTNETWDVFLYDRESDTVTRINHTYSGGETPDGAQGADISDDGQTIVFSSIDDEIVMNDTNGVRDIFVLEAGTISRISIDSAGNQANGHSYWAVISGDGNVVAFVSDATNLVAGDTNAKSDIFVHDRTTQQTTRVSVHTNGTQSNDTSIGLPALSYDGAVVAFESNASNFVSGDTTVEDIFVHDRSTQTTTLITKVRDTLYKDESSSPRLSADGRFVVFDSWADNLTLHDVKHPWSDSLDVYVHDRSSGLTGKVSHRPRGYPLNGDAYSPDISADGRYITFYSSASDLITGDTNGTGDIFVVDRLSGSVERVSRSAAGQEANDYSRPPVISADGTTIVFESMASNLVADDTNGVSDIFAVEQALDTSPLYTVSGAVLDDFGEVPWGVNKEVYSLFALANLATLDANGNYSLQYPAGYHELVVEDSFFDDWRFWPEPHVVTVSADVTGVDFTATCCLDELEGTYIATDDAYVDQAYPNVAFGQAGLLMVTHGTKNKNSYVKFSLNNLPTDGCTQIGNAWLGLTVKVWGVRGGSVYTVGSSWNENTIKWSNAPPINGAPLADIISLPGPEQIVWVNLGHVVNGPGVYSFALKNDLGNSVEYWSRNTTPMTDPPRLHLDYRTPDPSGPATDFTFTPGGGVAPLAVQFNDTSTGCPTRWEWDFGDGATSTARNPSHTFTSAGDFDVTLTTTNAEGSDSHTVTIIVDPLVVDTFISPSTTATLGGIAAQPADILGYSKAANAWAMVYDGSDHGTTKNVGAFHLMDDGSLLLVFSANQAIAGLGTATPYDVVKFTPDAPGVFPLGAGAYSWFFRGGVWGLTKAEKIDAIDLDGDRLLLSLAGAGSVPLLPSGVLKPADEDVFVFNRGTNQWESALLIDGSKMPGMAAEDISGLWDDPASGDYYVTITGAFNLGGVKGTGKSIVKLTPNGGTTVYTPSLVNWLAAGATFPSNLDGLALMP